MIFYFAYGHNTNTAVMKQRIPGAVYVGVATLPHYKMVMRQFADLEKGRGAKGVLWKISKSDLSTLDQYEEVYEHRRVRVYLNGTSHMAYAYFMLPCEAWHRPPSAKYVRHVQKGYAEHGLI